MQQEGLASVFLPRPASHCRASMFPCVEAPLGESTVLSAVCVCVCVRARAVLLTRVDGFLMSWPLLRREG